MPTAIEFDNISKQYRLGLVSTRTLSHDLNRWWKMNVLRRDDPYLKIGEVNDRAHKGVSDYVWALKDINFKVEQGDVLGIIGKNGAGKSTLLKILSKVTAPTTGTIRARGRIASLLEVGTGFHPEMTGRENIYMNGAIMGMTKVEITRKLDEIIDFSGVERYIDTPVKRYSSGMTVRLGFAIAAHLDPEILVVDEVLAVGDAEFQKKAIGKMQDVSKGEGRTVLFVSHNMGSIKQLCTNLLLLSNGNVSFQGSVDVGINQYLEINNFMISTIKSGIKFLHHDFEIHDITINSSNENIVFVNQSNNHLNLKINGSLRIEKKIAVEVRFYDSNRVTLAFFSPGHLNGIINKYGPGDFEINETIILPSNITKGEFFLDIYLTYPNVEGYMDIPYYTKIVTEGVIGKTGIEFDYNKRGLIIL